MEILFVSATSFESETVREAAGIGVQEGQGLAFSADGRFGRLVTGIGMVNTAWALGRTLTLHQPRLVLNLGIAGAFEGGPGIGEVVEITAETYSELGADSPTGYIDLQAMGFAHFQANGQDYFNEIVNPRDSGIGLRKCKGITVNRVHGETEGIREVVQRWAPEVESMEGAAVFQCCLMAGVPFICLRGISNRVEPRNRDNWRIREAIDAVEAVVIQHFLNDRS